MALAASPASAAFPGRNGLLAVQPLTGRGLVLVKARGGQERRICTDRVRCGKPHNPRWSPDGRALSFNASNIHLIYPDGSCLNCAIRGAGIPAFTANPALVSFVTGGELAEDGIDGIYKATILKRSFSDAVWSAAGELAAVHAGQLWLGSPSALRAFGLGSSPSWSPDGSRVAVDRKGWVIVIGVRHGSARRLVRGDNPAWSPDGRSIAFIDARHDLRVIPASGGRSRRVGSVRGYAVDWQPLPVTPPPLCVAPPGSTLLASSATGVVTTDSNPWSSAYMGCLRSDGRERFLERLDSRAGNLASAVSAAAVGDRYAALANESEDLHYGGSSGSVVVFDLRTGAMVPGRGGESAYCQSQGGGSCEASIDQVAVGTDGVSAAHTTSLIPPGSGSVPLDGDITCPSPSLCVATDGFGRVFTSTDPASGAWAVTNVPGLWALSCPSVSLCVGVGGEFAYTSTNPTGGAAAWTPALVHPGLNEIACPSTTLCVATDITGNVWTSTDPTAGAASWTSANVDGSNRIGHISCPSTSLCVAVDYNGNAVTSTNPGAGGAAAWQVHTLTGRTDSIVSVSCPSASLCVALDNSGDVLTSTTPSGSGPWPSVSLAGPPTAVDCPSASLCLAVGNQGTLDVSTDPVSGTWAGAVIDDKQQLRSIGCASASLCIAGDAAGNLVASPNPTGGGAAWTATLVDGNPCSAETWCRTEEIQSSDGTGVHTLDTLAVPTPATFVSAAPPTPPALLTNLSVSGLALTWLHAGTPELFQLQP
jgi:hypothetical protein